MVIRLGEISLGRGVASVTQFWRALRKQSLTLFGVMGRVAVEAANIAAGMRGRGKMRLLFTAAVAGQTACARLLTRRIFKGENLAPIAAAGHVVRPGTVDRKSVVQGKS